MNFGTNWGNCFTILNTFLFLTCSIFAEHTAVCDLIYSRIICEKKLVVSTKACLKKL